MITEYTKEQKRAITVFKRTLIKTFKKEIRILIKMINKLSDFINKKIELKSINFTL